MALATQPVVLRTRRTQVLLAPAEYWHLLSLDAPTVAALWSWGMARALRVRLGNDSLAILFIGTWLLYVADRILDGLHARHEPYRTWLRERHFFYIRHRTLALTAAVPVSVLLAWLVLVKMLPAARRADLLLFAATAIYFGFVHLRGHAIDRWFPKELLVALIAAAAIATPTWVRLAPGSVQSRATSGVFAALFAVLCWLNCIAIEKWEQSSQTTKVTVQSPRSRMVCEQNSGPVAQCGQRRLRSSGIAIAAAALAGVVVYVLLGLPRAALLCFSAALSGGLLAALDRFGQDSGSYCGLSVFHMRIAADAALITPLLLVFLRR